MNKLAFISFTPFFTAVYIVERLVLQTIYVLKKEILGSKIRGFKSRVDYNERFLLNLLIHKEADKNFKANISK